MYLAEHLTDEDCKNDSNISDKEINFSDLSGLFISQDTVMEIVESVLNGDIDTIAALSEAINCMIVNREKTEKELAMKVANDIYGWLSLDIEDRQDLVDKCRKTRNEWLALIAKDAEREYELGDVDRDTVDNFLNSTY